MGVIFIAIVRNLIVRAGADFSALRDGMRQAQRSINNFGSNINRSMSNVTKGISGVSSKIAGVMTAIAAAITMKDAIKSALDTEAAMQQVNRMMGSSADEFTDWANNNAAAFGMAKSQAMQYGAVYANLISGFSSGTQDTFQKTQQLLKTSAIVASSTGRQMEDVMERIRSGMLGNTEAIEDLGINVNVAMIQSTNAFKQFANGKSWQQLNFQTQQQILYMAILEQASKKYGDTLNQNTATSMAMFVAQLKNIQLSLGQAFLPILNVVLPVLTAFAAKIASVLSVVGQFMQYLFGKGATVKQQVAQAKATTQQANAVPQQANAVNGLGKALKKTSKEAKKAAKANKGVAGFDQVHTLNDGASGVSSGSSDPKSGTGGGSAGGGVSVPTIDTSKTKGALDKISNKVKEFADKVKKWLAPLKPYWDMLKKSVVGVYQSLKKLVTNPKLVKFFSILTRQILKSVMLALSGALDIVSGVIDFIVAMLNGDLSGAWKALKKTILGFFKLFAGMHFSPQLYESIRKIFPKIQKVVSDVFAKIKEIVEDAAKYIAVKIITIVSTFKDIKSSLSRKAEDLWKVITVAFNGAYTWFKTKVADKFVTSLSNIKNSVALKAEALWSAIKGKFSGVYKWLSDNVAKKFVDVLVNWKDSIASKAATIWSSIKGKFTGAYEWFRDSVVKKFYEAFENWKDVISGKANEIWSAIKGKFSNAYIWFRDSVVKKLYEALANWKDLISGKASEIWSSIKGKFTNVYNWFRDNVVRKLYDALVNWKDTIAGRASAIWSGIKGKFTGVYNWFRDNVAKKPMEALDNWRNAIAASAGRVWSAIKGKFTGVYDWFKKNVTDKISSAFDKIRTSFTSGLADGVKSLLNKLIDGINAPIKSLKKFSVLGQKPFSGLPTIPKLAKGGITNGPTLALIGDNPGGKEVVSPLDKLQGIVGTAVMQAMQFSNKGNNQSGDIILNIDGRAFARIIKPHLDKENKRIGNNVKLKPV